MDERNLGKVVGYGEERPVCLGSKGDLIAGPSSVYLDLLLSNSQGDERVLRVPVPEDVATFYAAR